MTTVIKTRGLVKQFRWVTALSDCDVTVPESRNDLGPAVTRPGRSRRRRARRR